MKIERIEIVSHPTKFGARQLEEELKTILEGRGLEVTSQSPDLILSLGGDGTVLRAAQRAHAEDAPLLGVNLGVLGYLTEVDGGKEMDALERVFSGDYSIEERIMLECAIDGSGSYVGLNEVLVERSSRERLVELTVDVGGERLASFPADGVLVATPTGSTAYALSAGGPIVDPRAHCLIVVPVSPHMIFSRPVVLASTETVQITVGGHRAASLTLDGAIGTELVPGAQVGIKKHARPLRFLRLSGPGFLERVRTKLRLPE
ncbi:MAG: NAD(+)/NADH kinase [Actinomycetota bacterium]|nr:NAD(+)/NADH kinase [Actinomycetota bacterium]